jgi:tellurium resistance protein TerZ
MASLFIGFFLGAIHYVISLEILLLVCHRCFLSLSLSVYLSVSLRDVTNGQNIDLDASCLMLDASLSVVDTISFKQLKSKDGSMVHHGDEREGDEEGDDESISFDLELVNPQATYLCFCINSFSGQKLNDVKDAKCRLYDNTTSHELASFDITSDKRLDCTALLMCILYRASAEGSGSQDWYMHAVGEPAEGRTVKDNVDEFQHFLDENPLVALQASRATVVKTIKIQVPESAADGGTIAFATPAGGQQEVKLPPGAKAGDMIEVPLVDIYTA